VTQKPKVAGGLVSGHDERRDADTTRQLLELDKDEHQSCGEHAPAASALSPADFGDANPKDVKAHSLSIPHACSDLTKAEDTNGANASPVSTLKLMAILLDLSQFQKILQPHVSAFGVECPRPTGASPAK